MAVKKKAKKRDEALAGIDDGCEPWLVEGARFDGLLEIPVIKRPERIAIPANMVPFSKRGSVDSPARYAVCCYELDRNFAPLLKEPEVVLVYGSAPNPPSAMSGTARSSSGTRIGQPMCARMWKAPSPRMSS